MSFKTAAYFLFKDKDLIIQDKLFLSFVLLVPQAGKTSPMKQYAADMNQMGMLHAEIAKWLFTEVYEEQRQRLTMMDANPESR